MNKRQDGKTQRDKKPDKGNILDRKRRVGRDGSNSPINGTQQINDDEENSTAGDSTGRIAVPDSSDGDTGKILERLHALEERYINYVKAHQSRLEARLDESKTDERMFLEESKSLESDILAIAKKREQTEQEPPIT
jgi:hypothetical protein